MFLNDAMTGIIRTLARLGTSLENRYRALNVRPVRPPSPREFSIDDILQFEG